MEKKIQWNPSVACNFDCEYCFCSRDLRKSQGQALGNVEGILKIFDSLEEEHMIVLGGGEPFYQKNFIELCEGLVKKHLLVVVTNLSYKIDKFCERIPADRVKGLAISLHYDERVRINGIEKFISKVHYLEDMGFPFQVSQVMYPPVMDRFEEIYNYFRDHGIKVYPKTFEGKYEDRPYPASYTEEEKEMLLKYLRETNEDVEDVRHSEEILFGYPMTGELTSFEGVPCSAGYDDVVIIDDGSAHRCWTIRPQYTKPEYDWINNLGNIYKGGIKKHKTVMPCTYKYCFCPQMGYDCTKRAREYAAEEQKNLIERLDAIIASIT